MATITSSSSSSYNASDENIRRIFGETAVQNLGTDILRNLPLVHWSSYCTNCKKPVFNWADVPARAVVALCNINGTNYPFIVMRLIKECRSQEGDRTIIKTILDDQSITYYNGKRALPTDVWKKYAVVLNNQYFTEPSTDDEGRPATVSTFLGGDVYYHPVKTAHILPQRCVRVSPAIKVSINIIPTKIHNTNQSNVALKIKDESSVSVRSSIAKIPAKEELKEELNANVPPQVANSTDSMTNTNLKQQAIVPNSRSSDSHIQLNETSNVLGTTISSEIRVPIPNALASPQAQLAQTFVGSSVPVKKELDANVPPQVVKSVIDLKRERIKNAGIISFGLLESDQLKTLFGVR